MFAIRVSPYHPQAHRTVPLRLSTELRVEVEQDGSTRQAYPSLSSLAQHLHSVISTGYWPTFPNIWWRSSS